MQGRITRVIAGIDSNALPEGILDDILMAIFSCQLEDRLAGRVDCMGICASVQEDADDLEMPLRSRFMKRRAAIQSWSIFDFSTSSWPFLKIHLVKRQSKLEVARDSEMTPLEPKHLYSASAINK